MLTAVTEDEPQKHSTGAPGGFVGGARKRAADEIEARRQAILAGPDVTVRWPSPAERAQGIAALFTYMDGSVEIEGHASRGDSGLVITQVQVTAPLPTGVTQRALRDAPLAAIIKQIRAYVLFEQARREGTRAIFGQEPAPGLFRPGDERVPQTSGRTPMTDDLLRAVALAFIEETGPGKDKRAIQRLAKRFNRPEGTLRTWIARARREGWLTPGSKGRIGAEAGPKLIAYDFDKGIDEPEPPGGARTGGDLVHVKPGTEAQIVEFNQERARREKEIRALPDGDPHKAQLEREMDAFLRSGGA